MTKYEIRNYGKDRIVPIKCVKETEKTLWIEFEWLGQKSVCQRRKCSDIHDTWADACVELIRRTQLKISTAEIDLKRAQAELAEISALQDPTMLEIDDA